MGRTHRNQGAPIREGYPNAEGFAKRVSLYASYFTISLWSKRDTIATRSRVPEGTNCD